MLSLIGPPKRDAGLKGGQSFSEGLFAQVRYFSLQSYDGARGGNFIDSMHAGYHCMCLVGPTPPEAGAIVELSRGGTVAIDLPGTGEQRRFLEDGDSVILRGWCEKPGAARIGFGQCQGEVLPVRHG